MVDLSFFLFFIVAIVLIGLWFYLISGFVSVNTQFKSRTIKSNWTFIDTNPWIKKNHIPIKTIATIKTKGNTQINNAFPEDVFNHQKHVLEKNR